MTAVTCFYPRSPYTSTVDYELRQRQSPSNLVRTLAIRLAWAALLLVIAARLLA